MNAWLIQHVQATQLVLRRFSANKLSTLLICLAIGVTLALPSLMYAVLDSVSGLSNQLKAESHISVFLAIEHDKEAIDRIQDTLEKNAAIKSVKFVSKQTALEQLKADNANNVVLNTLEQNPLPDAFFVEPKNLTAQSIENLKSEISKIDAVEEVIVNDAWIKRLNYLLLLGKKALLMIAGLLAIAMVTVIGNTIRMQIVTQYAEIELSQLIGATKSFIRRPFLYAGLLYGLIGGLAALLMTIIVILLFNQSLAPLVAEYQTDFSLNMPGLFTCFIICALSVLIGLISAYFAVSKALLK